ncbi:MAG: pantoate--beta-alanine ligase [Flaviflexus sp.]|nr:pantoate--beta-alanine ligase [Flaviflexus sp.]
MLVRTKQELREEVARLTGSIGLVMTMGALHEGHLNLVRRAREECEHVVVSIYVNPLQFGPGEDFDAYPRTLEADLELLGDVDIVFAPSDEEMYGSGPLVRIDPGELAGKFEGKTRPTHFAGVAQVVTKVINLVRPDKAFFGQKDAQQLALVRLLNRELDLGTEIVAVPIARSESGLALSSRNSYLSEEEQERALALHEALLEARAEGAAGASAEQVEENLRQRLSAAPGVQLDYAAVVDPVTFGPAGTAGLAIVAAWVGPTRLIDNMEVTCG